MTHYTITATNQEGTSIEETGRVHLTISRTYILQQATKFLSNIFIN